MGENTRNSEALFHDHLFQSSENIASLVHILEYQQAKHNDKTNLVSEKYLNLANSPQFWPHLFPKNGFSPEPKHIRRLPPASASGLQPQEPSHAPQVPGTRATQHRSEMTKWSLEDPLFNSSEWKHAWCDARSMVLGNAIESIILFRTCRFCELEGHLPSVWAAFQFRDSEHCAEWPRPSMAILARRKHASRYSLANKKSNVFVCVCAVSMFVTMDLQRCK